MSLYLLKYLVLLSGGFAIGWKTASKPWWVGVGIGIPFAVFVSYLFHTYVL